tara:strand:+ start:56 stop:244 length:189 start_codon:yes stop_codon:yes gene_type:complete
MMATNKELENQVNELKNRIAALSNSNSVLADEVANLKNNYNQLVKDVSNRLEVVHKKVFRQT